MYKTRNTNLGWHEVVAVGGDGTMAYICHCSEANAKMIADALNVAQPARAVDGACPECKQLAGYHKTDCQNWLWQL